MIHHIKSGSELELVLDREARMSTAAMTINPCGVATSATVSS